MTTSSEDVDTPGTVRKLSIAAEEVREAIEVEHNLTFLQALKLYPKAIGWSMYFSLGVIMLGMVSILVLRFCYAPYADRNNSVRPPAPRELIRNACIPETIRLCF